MTERPSNRFHGLSAQRVAEVLAEQGGRCAICLTDEPTKGHGWCIEHDHTSGNIRGIVCSKCNSLIGFAERSADPLGTLRRALAYLENPRTIERDLGPKPRRRRAPCADCGAPRSRNAREQWCGACWPKHRPKVAPTKTTLARYHSDPEYRAKVKQWARESQERKKRGEPPRKRGPKPRNKTGIFVDGGH
jgi:hypothetical protein